MFTNVSSDHLDLGGVHTLPELAEVKGTVCRVTKPDGWVDPQRRRPPGRRDGPPRPRPGLVLLDGPGRVRAPRPAPPRRRPGARPARRPAGGVGRAGRARDPRRRGPAGCARWIRPPQRRERPGRGRRRQGDGRHARACRRRPARLPALRGPVAGTHEPVPARAADGHRGLRPQRGRHGGDHGRRRGPRPGCGRERGLGHGRDAGPDHRDHRHRGRPPGRHAARHRADRGGTGGPRRDQGDAQLPAGPRPGRGDRDPPRRGDRRGEGPGGDPRLRDRAGGPGGGADRIRGGGRRRRRAGRAAGGGPVLPRGARRRLRPAGAPGRDAGGRGERPARCGDPHREPERAAPWPEPDPGRRSPALSAS